MVARLVARRGLVFGLALSVASTVVLLRALQERRLLETERGRIAVGWLIVEDIAMVLALVLLPALRRRCWSGERRRARSTLAPVRRSALTLGKVAAFVAVMLVVGRRVIPWILQYVAHTGSRELFRLAVLAIALGVAFGAAMLFGVSFALGAFFAGMMLSEIASSASRRRPRSLPLRDAFAVLFFVSVGMLFDPAILMREPLAGAGDRADHRGRQVAGRVRDRARLRLSRSHRADDLGEPGADRRVLLHPGRPRRRLGLLPEQGRDLILAGAIISILLNPLLFAALDRLAGEGGGEIRRGMPPAAAETRRPRAVRHDRLTDHVVLVGHGRVGSFISAALPRADRRCWSSRMTPTGSRR